MKDATILLKLTLKPSHFKHSADTKADRPHAHHQEDDRNSITHLSGLGLDSFEVTSSGGKPTEDVTVEKL